MHKRTGLRRGFTLVELIVVIAVIGILASIAIVGFGKYQGDARDARRSSSANVISESLEKYYDQNGEYPGCSQISGDASVVTRDILKGVNDRTLIAPAAASGQTNSIKCTSAGNVLAANNGADFFEYQGDGSAECAADGPCLSYVLKYKRESDGTIQSINSRHSTSIATSGTINDLKANSTSFTTVSLSWGAISNASSYDIQTSSTNTFASNTQTSSPTTGATFGNLTAGNTYYFRVRPVNGTTQGAWSNIASATTRSLGTPVAKATVPDGSGKKVTLTWGAVTYATSYKIERSTSGSFPSANTDTYSQTTTSKNFTDESPGIKKYYRVTALATGDTSDPSATVSAVTSVKPAAFSISKNDPQYNIERVTSNATCAAGTTVSYRWYKNGTFWKEGTGSSYKTVDAQFPAWDYTLTVTSQARCTTANYQSDYTSASNSVSRRLSRPTATIGVSDYRTASWTGTCPDGTTSKSFSWKITGEGLTKSGTSSSNGSYSNQNVGWGDGNTYVVLHCKSAAPYGWGDITATGNGPFGAGCTPTKTKSICSAR